jgi:hypothetical protein
MINKLFKKGDRVRVINSQKSKQLTKDECGWIKDMDKTLGKIGEVTSSSETDGRRVNVRFDSPINDSWAYVVGSLKLVDDSKKKVKKTGVKNAKRKDNS